MPVYRLDTHTASTYVLAFSNDFLIAKHTVGVFLAVDDFMSIFFTLHEMCSSIDRTSAFSRELSVFLALNAFVGSYPFSDMANRLTNFHLFY